MAHPDPAVRALVAGMPLERFSRALGPAPEVEHLPPVADPFTPSGRDELIRWLRSWGCRHLRVEDHARTSRSLRAWALGWLHRLPSDGLVELSSQAIAESAEAYDALARRRAAFAARPSGTVSVTFGPTAASKAMYALRPAAFPPWDAAMRAALRLGDGAPGYAAYLSLSAEGIRGIAGRAGIEPEALPAAVGRPGTTAPRLIDEYLLRALRRGAARPRGRAGSRTPTPG